MYLPVMYNCFSQAPTGNIKGVVVDKFSQLPLTGATVIVEDADPPFGSVTDTEGKFKLEDIETGRMNLVIQFIGYEPHVVTNLNLTSGKDLFVRAELEEKIIEVDEVTVKASNRNNKPLNSMAMLSARTFSVEESQRFAGARNDVARMASNYAGVSTANDAENGIVIRGNSPNGLLWRLEGIEIPNPNHFGFMGAAGGPVGMLNNNVSSNSDFYTGAFPAEYGNALSGVFDLNMRDGNYDKIEIMGQIGFNGLEAGIEGPLPVGKNSSFLINYRYSTLAVMNGLGFDFGTGTAIPYYQDLSMKVNIPTSNSGTFSLFGLGGISSIDLLTSDKDSTELIDDFYNQEWLDIYNKNKLGVLGLNHLYFFGSNTYAKFAVAFTGIANESVVDSVSTSDYYPVPFVRTDLRKSTALASYMINHKFNARLNGRLGFSYQHIAYSLSDSVYLQKYTSFFTRNDESDYTGLLQGYFQTKYKLTNQLTINTGIHYQHLLLNNSNSIEPRVGIKYNFLPGHTISLAYGKHSKMPPVFTYFTRVDINQNEYVQPNLKLKFPKSHHLVAGYDWNITRGTRLKTEVYYQYVYDALVEASPSPFSMINNSSMNFAIPDSLINGGTGENYGIELTLEKFMDKGFYYLITTSLFRSEYTGSDDTSRYSAFDGIYVTNILAGKEFKLSSKKYGKNMYLTVDGRVTSAGGQRYTPVDLDASARSNSTKYIMHEAFERRFKPYFRADIRVAFRIDSRKFSQEWAFDVQNITNTENPLFIRYNRLSNTTSTIYQLKMFPMFQYKIMF